MARTFPRYRRFLAISAMVAVVGIVSLSVAARHPYLSRSASTWHISKASRMSAVYREKATKAPLDERVSRWQKPVPRRFSFPAQEVVLRKLPPISPAYYLRPPPAV